MTDMDPAAELAAIRQRRKIARRQPYRKSKLERHRAELVKLRRAGASYPELVTWLRLSHQLTVVHTTVMRYLQELPEMSDPQAQGDA